MVSTGCNKDVERPEARPPVKADRKTLPAGISTGGATGTTVAASNHTFLCPLNTDALMSFSYSMKLKNKNMNRNTEKL